MPTITPTTCVRCEGTEGLEYDADSRAVQHRDDGGPAGPPPAFRTPVCNTCRSLFTGKGLDLRRRSTGGT